MKSDGDHANRFVEVKISSDRGETWYKRKINFGKEVEESGLRLGEIFMFQNEQYEVRIKDGEMIVEKSEKPIGRKKTVNCF